MRRTFRWLIRPFWRATSPVRRAVMGRFDARVVRLVAGAIEAGVIPPIAEAMKASDDRLERIEALIDRADRSASKLAEEIDVVLNGLSREIFRLQGQVEKLRRDASGEDRVALGGLSLLPESGADRSDSAPAERSRVG